MGESRVLIIESMAAMTKPRRVSNMTAMRRAAHLSWHFAASEVGEAAEYEAQGHPEESTVRRVVDIRRLRKQLPYFLSAESIAAPEQLKTEEVNTARSAQARGLVRSAEPETCPMRTPSQITEVNNIDAMATAAKSRR